MSPGIGDTVALLGKTETLARAAACLAARILDHVDANAVLDVAHRHHDGARTGRPEHEHEPIYAPSVVGEELDPLSAQLHLRRPDEGGQRDRHDLGASGMEDHGGGAPSKASRRRSSSSRAGRASSTADDSTAPKETSNSRRSGQRTHAHLTRGALEHSRIGARP